MAKYQPWYPSPRPIAREHALGSISERAIERASAYLHSLQHPEGYFVGELEANVSHTAQYVFTMHMLERHDAQREQLAVAELLAAQLPDGGYALHTGGRSDLSLTVEAYVAMKLAGVDVDCDPMQRARRFICARGGVAAARVFTKQFLAMMGLWDYALTPTLPAWLMQLPARGRFSIYEMSCWARCCVVPLLIILDQRAVFPLARAIDIDELILHGDRRGREQRVNWRRPWSIENGLVLADRVFASLQRLGCVPLRERSLADAEAWILAHQDPEGDVCGIVPALTYSLLALRVRGHGPESPAMRAGWAALERYTRVQEGRLRMQCSVGPVWDSALALMALRAAGVEADDPTLTRAARWLLGREVRVRGDWALQQPAAAPPCEPGGWSFEFNNRDYPDNDDSSMVTLALDGLALGEYYDARSEQARARAETWLRSMQCESGGWAAFDLDRKQRWLDRVPFADMGGMIDPPSPDVTGHVLEALGARGRDRRTPTVARALAYLRRTQEADGSWYGRWGVNYIYGTGAVVPGLVAVGVTPESPLIRRALAFLLRTQNTDGGWGESCSSYECGHYLVAPSTASQTAWALLALIAAGQVESSAVERGVAYLLATQRLDGGWDESAFTGTGFPRTHYLRYELYSISFPLLALARFVEARGGQP